MRRAGRLSLWHCLQVVADAAMQTRECAEYGGIGETLHTIGDIVLVRMDDDEDVGMDAGTCDPTCLCDSHMPV